LNLAAARRRVPVLLCAVLAACSSERARTGIVVLVESPPDSLDVRFALTTTGQRVAQLVSPGLVTFDERGEPIGDLAEEFHFADPQTLDFTLRKQLTFHDGSALTAQDVKATFEGLVQPSFGSPRADKLEAVDRIEALSPTTVRFHLKRPYSPILAELSLGIVPRARAFQPAAAEQDRAPIGAGPFAFAAQPDDEHLWLVPFDRYYGGRPRIGKLLIRTVRDQTTRVLELLKGRADLVVGAVSPSIFPALRRDPHLRIAWRPGSAYTYLGLNVRTGPLADVRVREAICHAIDVRPIIEAKLQGLAEPATGMLPRTHWAYAPTPGCRRDLELTARLLEQAGYRSRRIPAPDARSKAEVGSKPILHLTLKTSTDRFRKSIALVFQEQLAEAGIAVDVRSLEFGTFFNDVRKGNFEVFSLQWSQVIEPDQLRWAFSSSFIPGPENAFGGLNRTGYRSDRVDTFLNLAARTQGADRRELYAQALALIDADLPYIPLWHESSPAVVSSRLQDYEPSPHGFLSPLARAREAAP
jgi:peptide/nickel transport system substrate-binding protein